MKPNKRLAAVVAGALALSGAAALSVASPASAATTINESGLQLFAQVHNNGLSGVQNLQPSGTPNNTAGHNLTITVSPSTSVAAGAAIAVTISSSTLTLCNGPAAASPALGEELDAVIVINGTQYLLRGPQNSVSVPASIFVNANHAQCNHPLFNTGWVVSSAPGGSSATSDTTNTAATTGVGTTTPAAPSTVVSLTAPSSSGTFNVALKGLVVNSLGDPTVLPYTPTPALNNPFDQPINLDNGGHSSADPNGPSYCDNSGSCAGYAGPGGIPGDVANSANGGGSFLYDDPGMYISAASASPPAPTTANYLSTTVNNPSARNVALPASTNWVPVTLTVSGPQTTITGATNLGVDGALGGTGANADTPLNLGPAGVPYVRTFDALNMTGNANWTPNVPAANITYNLCPAAGNTGPGLTAQGCVPITVSIWYSILSGTAGTDGSGQLNPVTLKLGSSVSGVGAYNLWTVECSAACTGSNTVHQAKSSIQLLGPRLLSTTASTVSPGTPYPVSGSNWYPGETVSVKGGKLGAAVGGGITSTTAVVGSTGTVTVTVTTASAHGLTTSNYVRVSGTTNGGGVNIANVKVASPTTTTFSYTDPFLSGPPSTTLIPPAADTGTVTIAPGTPSSTDTASTIVASNTGTISGTASTTDSTSNEFYATGIQNGGPVGTAPAQNYAESNGFTLAADQCTAVGNGNFSNNVAAGGLGGANPGSCSTTQNLNAVVTAGSLKQAAVTTGSNPNDTTVTLGSTQTSIAGSTLTQPFNSITVTDTRGGTFGWSLIASAPSFTATGGLSISNSLLSVTPACAVDTTQANPSLSAPTGTTGGTQNFSGPVNLCTKAGATPNPTTGSTSGQWVVSGPLSLAVPAFQAAGAYSTTMTVTLS